MIVLVGLAIFLVAMAVGTAGVLANDSIGHELPLNSFAVLGYQVTGSTGALFLTGIVVGVVGVLGLSVLLAGARLSANRGTRARSELRQSRRETAALSRERDAVSDHHVVGPVRRENNGRSLTSFFRSRKADERSIDAAHRSTE